MSESSPGALCWNLPSPSAQVQGCLPGGAVFGGGWGLLTCAGASACKTLTGLQSPTSLLFLPGSYVNYPTGPCWLQIINSHQHKQELMCLERLSEFFLPFFLPFSLSLQPFTSSSLFSIVFLHIFPFRQKCCKSFPPKGCSERQRGAKGKRKQMHGPFGTSALPLYPEISP